MPKRAESEEEEDAVPPPWVLPINRNGKFQIHWGSVRKYKFGRHLGSGSFGDCFEGRHKESGILVAIKEMKMDAPKERDRTKKEINTLLRVHDGPNIVRLYDTCRDSKNTNYLVFEFLKEDRWQPLYAQLTDYDIRFYIYKLLLAVSYAHKRKVLHRDIKPHNVLIDHSRRSLRLIDWGCAGLYVKGKSFKRFPGTKPYKAPECLMRYRQYGPPIDMWGVGILLATMAFGRRPFFDHLATDEEQLRLIVKILGVNGLEELCESLGVEVPDCTYDCPKKHAGWKSLVTDENEDTANRATIAFLRKVLVYDPTQRLTARAALRHPYFADVRRDAMEATRSSDSDAENTELPEYEKPTRDEMVEFGIGYSELGKISHIGYTSSTSSGFFEKPSKGERGTKSQRRKSKAARKKKKRAVEVSAAEEEELSSS